MRALAPLALPPLLALLALAGACHLDCNPARPPCSEYTAVSLTVCDASHLRALTAAHASCAVLLLEGYPHVHEDVTVFAPDAGSIPLCGSARARSAASMPRTLAQRLGDVRFPTQHATAAAAADFYKEYHTLAVLQARWEELAAYSPAARLETYGESVQGRALRLVRLGVTPADRPVRVVINGLQHAREWASTMVVTYIADALAASLADAPRPRIGALTSELNEAAALLRGIEVVVAPMANPDGYVYTQTSRFHRKNMRPSATIPDCPGVDLNRNWPTDYNGGEATSANPCSDVFVGAGVLSEPEVRALAELLAEPGVVAHVDYHAYGGMVLGPWAHSDVAPTNGSAWVPFGAALVAGLRDAGVVYRAGLGSDRVLPYLASGVMTDWAHTLGLHSATVEVSPVVAAGESFGLGGFLLDEELLQTTCTQNFAGFISMLRWVNATHGIGAPAATDADADTDVDEESEPEKDTPVVGGAAPVPADGLGKADDAGGGVNAAAIAGGVVGGVVLLAAVALGAWYLLAGGAAAA